MALRHRLALAALTIAAGCSPMRPADPTSSPSSVNGRSHCAGSVPVALTNLQGAAGDDLERLQATYGVRPGFRAVVFDGKKAIVVVDRAHLAAWSDELSLRGISVAPSCVDPSLLAEVLEAVPRLARTDGISSVGYDALDDSIDVIGVDADALVNALDGKDHRVGALARAALAEGTLRVR